MTKLNLTKQKEETSPVIKIWTRSKISKWYLSDS